MGRALAFDREQVLSQVTELFWLKGYQATSVADLVQKTQLKPGSLYNTFTSKHQLLLESIELYGRGRVEWVRSILQQQLPLDQLLRQLLLRMIDQSCNDSDAKGCFLLNLKLEMGAVDPAVQAQFELTYGQIEQALVDVINRAIKRDEFCPVTDVRVLAKYLVMSIWGLRILGRDRISRATMEAMVDQIMISALQTETVQMETA